MAGDRQFTHGGVQKFRGKTKIYELPTLSAKALFDNEKVLVGFCGDASMIGTCLEYLFEPHEFEKPPRVKGIEMVSLNSKGHIHLSFNLRQWLLIDQPYYAIGSGMMFAMGALANGASPLDAVKAAAKMDPSTGMGYTTLNIK